jgi:diguanylate cyclase (GGDEF)-like protein
MLLVDIDNLKMINDRHGHVAGDTVIARAAEAIRQSIRYGDDCARLGGDEFMIFASNCDADGAAEIGRRVLARLAREVPIAEARFGVSIGIAVQERAAADFDRMYRDADAALYYAKTKGKSRIVLFAPFMAAALQP